MSSLTSEQVTPLNFSHAVVERTMSEVRAQSFREVVDSELPHIEGNAIYALREGLLQETAPLQDEALVVPPRLGFMLATRLVRYAGDEMLPRRSPALVAAFSRRGATHPEYLDQDFRQNYAPHPAVLELFSSKLKTERTIRAGKLVLNVFGDLANPDQPPIVLPPMSSPALPRRRSGRSFAAHNQL